MDFEAQAQESFDNSLMSSKLVLYSFWQSSCSWRVRFALNLKGLSYEYRAVNLGRGEHLTPDFERLNPLKYVPVLVDGPVVVSDSYAILLVVVGMKRREMTLFESVYLEEKYPQKTLLPADLHSKSLNLQVASIVSTSIQPLHMMGLLKTIEEKFGSEEQQSWAQSNLEKGFNALEKLLRDFAGRYATGDEVYMADVFLAPQISVAVGRIGIDMSTKHVIIHNASYCNILANCYELLDFNKSWHLLGTESKFPVLARIYESYKTLPEFQASSPERQPDAIH